MLVAVPMSGNANVDQDFDSNDARTDFENILQRVLDKANAEERYKTIDFSRVNMLLIWQFFENNLYLLGRWKLAKIVNRHACLFLR